MKRFLLQYGLGILIASGISVGIIAARGGFAGAEGATLWRALSDGFLASGVLYFGIGVLISISGTGALDGLRFAFRNLFVSLRGKEYRDAHRMTYGEYQEKRHERKSNITFLYLIGGTFLVLAVVFTILFFTNA